MTDELGSFWSVRVNFYLKRADSVPVLACRVLMAFLTLALIPPKSSAHLGDTIGIAWEIAPADMPDVNDESLEDWEAVLPGASLDQGDFSNLVFRDDDPSDFAFRIFIGWNDESQQLALAFERLDDRLITQLDRMAIMIDGDHSGGRYVFWGDEFSEAETAESYSQAQSYGLVADPQQDVYLTHSGPAAHWAAVFPYTYANGFQIGDEPSYSVVELVITPWDRLTAEGPETSRRTVLRPGGIIGLDIALSDVDEPPVDGSAPVSNFYKLAPQGNPQGGSSVWAGDFADVELVPCSLPGCSGDLGSAVQFDSWARVKASLFKN